MSTPSTSLAVASILAILAFRTKNHAKSAEVRFFRSLEQDVKYIEISCTDHYIISIYIYQVVVGFDVLC